MATGRNCCFSDMNKKRGFIRELSLAPYKDKEGIGFTSKRNYDYFKNHIKAWLGDEYVKNVRNDRMIIKIEPRDIKHNPYTFIYKMHSVNPVKIYCYFTILDALNQKTKDGSGTLLSYNDIFDGVDNSYYKISDLSSHNKRKELCCYNTFKAIVDELCKTYGILQMSDKKKDNRFSFSETKLSLERWKDALDFFCEYDALGVLGTFILDRIERGDYSSNASPLPRQESCFSFKHHYLYQVIDSDNIEQLLQARKTHCFVEAVLKSNTSKRYTARFVPMKFYFNVKNGRRYVLGMSKNDVDQTIKLNNYRIDRFVSVKVKNKSEVSDFEAWKEILSKYEENMWGVSIPHYPKLDHIEMTVVVPDGCEFVLTRLEREKKCGKIECIDDVSHRYRYSADVHDANELLPWIRSFTGFIENLFCSSKEVTDKFYRDFNDFAAMYGE